MTTLIDNYPCSMLGAPFKVMLRGAVLREDDAVVIPRLAEMIATAAAARLRQPRRLAGDDLLFLRKSAGMTISEITAATGLGSEEYKAFERGSRPMPEHVEKLLRIIVFERVRGDLAPARSGVEIGIAHIRWVIDDWRARPTIAGRGEDITLGVDDDGWHVIES